MDLNKDPDLSRKMRKAAETSPDRELLIAGANQIDLVELACLQLDREVTMLKGLLNNPVRPY
jgi:hypothetical protein